MILNLQKTCKNNTRIVYMGPLIKLNNFIYSAMFDKLFP